MFKFILDLLFPVTCLGGCGRFDVWLCDNCINKLNIKPSNKKFNKSHLDGLYYCDNYNNQILSSSLHFFKYKYITDLAKPLGKIMYMSLPSKSYFDLIAFVPMHKKKELVRCFNQTYLLAKEISNISKLPIARGVLQKNKNTAAQMTLKENDRKANLKNAFICLNKNAVKNKKILIVDDVYTTGSTLRECAYTLKKAGGSEVWGLVLAKG